MPIGSQHGTNLFEWRLTSGRRIEGGGNSLVVGVFVIFFIPLLLSGGLSCKGNDNPQVAFDQAYKTLLHGDLKQAQTEAHRECQRYQKSGSPWAWKFRGLEATAELQQGLYEEALKLIASAPLPSDQPDLVVRVLMLGGEANTSLHNFAEAERSLNEATRLCDAAESPNCGYVLKARGLLAIELNRPEEAERLFKLTLAFARSHHDALLEAHALLNLGNESLSDGRYDESVDRSEAAYQSAKTIDARILELITQANIGWAYYKLGDKEKALELSEESEKLAAEVGDIWDQENALTNIGYIYMDERKFDAAGKSFQQALKLAQSIDAKEDIYNVLRVLARLSLQTGDFENASGYAQQAMKMAQRDKNHLDELYPLLAQGQVGAARGRIEEAEAIFRQVERDKICPVFLKWEAEHSLARLYEDEKRPEAADREYRAALATFEAARDTVRHEDSQISFLTNASRIYDDYVHFLVARGKGDDALRWADFSRARTLNEGLGLLSKGSSTGAPALLPRQIAQRAGGTILFYWLGEKQSYLWGVTPQKVNLFTLPGGAEIDAAVQRYRKSLAGPQDVLVSNDQDGRWLYNSLIAPAHALLDKKDSRVFIIPDGSLNNLNFETLIVPGNSSESATINVGSANAQPHFWIEDVTLGDASSLRVLGAAHMGKKSNNGRERLLLVGNSVAPNDKYPELPKAETQMESVASHFQQAEKRILSREQATPAAYMESKPEQFSYIHFVAHGTASRLSPLDSAIVLSKGGIPQTASMGASQSDGTRANAETLKGSALAAGSESDSFKLYARDIIHHPLRADLVTISACYGAGERAYSGEGLVGLSWAFLRAGAHNVVAALWEATDSSTEQLMDKFYEEIGKGAAPDAALRAAKLSLLHGSVFHNPFYWAPFQLYTGS